MTKIELHHVGKFYAAFEAIKAVELTIEDREFVVFVGPSGCGKSTLLRMIAGLEEITSGDLLIDGVRANAISPDKRGLAMVFQSYALYPHMTVAQNMGFALKMAKVPKAEIARKVNNAARILQLDTVLARKPGMLSGGQRQRVAIGRAIVRDPKGFLFDEPLSNLDAALRVQMRTELIKLHKDLAATMIYVTHDQVEAMTMADRIVVLNKGHVEQVGAPLELYHRPNNLFVAGFIGSPKMNFFRGRAGERANGAIAFELTDGRMLKVPAPTDEVSVGTPLTLGIRPEHLVLVDAGPLDGEVEIIEHLGAETLVYVKSATGGTIVMRTSDLAGVRLGARVSIGLDPGRASLFDEAGDAILHAVPD